MLLTEIFVQIVTMSVVASLTVVFVVIARAALRRAPRIFSYLLWSVVLFRLLCPVSFSSPLSLLGIFEAKGSKAYEALQERQRESGAAEADLFAGAPTEEGKRAPAAGNAAGRTAPVEDADGAGASGTRSGSAAAFLRAASVIWVLGAGVMLFFSAWSVVRLKKRLSGAVWVEENIYETGRNTIPFVFGILRPRIYLPESLAGEERAYILLHERTHIRRGDHIVKALAYFALLWHWFNPLIWLAFYLAERDMEMSCDEAVMRQTGKDIRASYSESLLGLAAGSSIIAGTPLAFGEGDTRERVKNVMRYKKPVFAVSVAAAVAVALLLAVLAGNPKDAAAKEAQQAGQDALQELQAHKAQEAQAQQAEQDALQEMQAHKAQEAQAQQAERDAQAEEMTRRLAQEWAEAFCGRDGEKIAAMSTEAVQKLLTEQELLETGEDFVSFGWSSPWPMFFKDSYEIVSVDGAFAEILYYAWVSDPHVTVWKETLCFENGRVSFEELVYYDDIDSMEAYRAAYPSGVNNTPMDYLKDAGDGGMGVYLNQHVMEAAAQSMAEPIDGEETDSYYGRLYDRLTDPEQAALFLLNISDDESRVKTAAQRMEDGSVTVTIRFAGEDAGVSVRMIRPYAGESGAGQEGIWIAQDAE